MMKTLKSIWNILLALLFLGCASHKPITNTVFVHTVDSIAYVDTVVYFQPPIEKIVEVCPMVDTLRMENSLSFAICCLDTATKSLKGTLDTKDTLLPVRTKIKEKYVYRDTTITKTITNTVTKIKEKPVIPKWCKWLLGILISLSFWAYRTQLLKLLTKFLRIFA